MLPSDVPPGKRLSPDVTLSFDFRIKLRRGRFSLGDLWFCGYRHYARRAGRIYSTCSAAVMTDNAL
jgi:hypothetical protein